MVEQVNRAAFQSAEPSQWLVPRIALNGRFLTQPTTGVQRVARALLAELDALAADGRISAPRVLIPKRAELIDPPHLNAAKLERVGQLSGHAWEQLELSRHAGPDLLLCLGNTAPVARLKRGRFPTAVMVHDLSYLYFPTAYDWRFRLLYHAIIPTVLHHSTHLFTVSNAEKSAIQTCYPATFSHASFHALQNGGATQAPTQASTHAPAAKAITRERLGLYVGSLSDRKNAKGVLRVAIRLLQSDITARFEIIGGTAQSLASLDLKVPADIASRLIFRGQMNDPNVIAEAYQRARFLLFPSFYEASPLPPIEAMHHGCPVMCSTIPSLRERCGPAALYRAPSDYQGFLEDARLLLDNEDVWTHWSDLGRSHAQNYTWRAQLLSLLSVLEPSP